MKGQASILINQPPEAVFASVTDPAQNDELPRGPGIRQIPEGLITANTSFHLLAMEKHRWFKGHIIVTAYQPNTAFALDWSATLFGIFSIRLNISYYLAAAPEGTLLTLAMVMERRGRIKSFARLLQSLFAQIFSEVAADHIELSPDASAAVPAPELANTASLDDYAI